METFDDITSFIFQVSKGENQQSAALAGMKDRYHSVQDGTSSEKLYRYLKETYEFDRGRE